jgi:hypothetical protein
MTAAEQSSGCRAGHAQARNCQVLFMLHVLQHFPTWSGTRRCLRSRGVAAAAKLPGVPGALRMLCGCSCSCNNWYVQPKWTLTCCKAACKGFVLAGHCMFADQAHLCCSITATPLLLGFWMSVRVLGWLSAKSPPMSLAVAPKTLTLAPCHLQPPNKTSLASASLPTPPHGQSAPPRTTYWFQIRRVVVALLQPRVKAAHPTSKTVRSEDKAQPFAAGRSLWRGAATALKARRLTFPLLPASPAAATTLECKLQQL